MCRFVSSVERYLSLACPREYRDPAVERASLVGLCGRRSFDGRGTLFGWQVLGGGRFARWWGNQLFDHHRTGESRSVCDRVVVEVAAMGLFVGVRTRDWRLDMACGRAHRSQVCMGCVQDRALATV